MKSVLVDTDVFSFLLKGDTRAGLYALDLGGRRLHLAFTTLAEVRYWGLHRNWGARRWELLGQSLCSYVLLGSDDQTAWRWAQVATHERRAGRDRHDRGDWWIAACALRHDMPLVTHNAGHFGAIPKLQVITHEASSS